MTEYYIWLQLAFGAGCKKTDLILQQNDIKKFYQQVQAGQSFPFLTQPDLNKLKKASIEKARKIALRTKELGYEIIYYGSRLYPKVFYNLYEKPAVLYTQGNPAALMNTLSIGIVGSRELSDYGLQACRKIGGALAAAGVHIISGFARGCDGSAHRAALEAGGKTIAVLGCGLDIQYPLENMDIREKIACNGAIVTEYPLGMRPLSYHFPKRNRLISALSRGILVVEAGETSGALITANLALEQGRDVFTIPNNIFHAGGNMRLLRDGAIPVSCAKDILLEYPDYVNTQLLQKAKRFEEKCKNQQHNIKKQEQQTDIKEEAPFSNEQVVDTSTLEKSARSIYLALCEQPSTVNDIVEKTKLPLQEILCQLTNLELDGLVASHPGRRFSRKI